MGKNQHILQREGRWAVRGEGNDRDTVRCDTQAEAIRVATEIAKNQRGELVIHDRNGRIRERNSYGNDPFPPRAIPVSKSQHILRKQDGRWSVRSSGAARASKIFRSRARAVAYARELAKKNLSGLYIHNKDGSIAGYISFEPGQGPPKKR